MSIENKFKESEVTVKQLKTRPTNDELLKLYGLYKQATAGDASGKRPSLINVKARAKWDAWKELQGLEKMTAMENYCNEVSGLVGKYGKS